MLAKEHRDTDGRRAADGGIDGQKQSEKDEVKGNQEWLKKTNHTDHGPRVHGKVH